MLILGILAAIAIPAFFNQREKATDAQAKSAAGPLRRRSRPTQPNTEEATKVRPPRACKIEPTLVNTQARSTK